MGSTEDYYYDVFLPKQEKEQKEQKTAESLVEIVEKMKEATVESGSGYWDLYSAMGGENSMPAWVEKGLAGNDHIHFSSKGAKIASQMFYDALISEYVKWNNNN